MTSVRPIPERLKEVIDRPLLKGAHSPDGKMCVMEMVAYIAGEPWSDHPACVSPAIGAFLRSWNDSLDDEPRQKLKPYVLRVVGTNTGEADEQTRGALAMDWLVRVHTPAWLELAGLEDDAAELRALPEITPGELSVAVQATLEKARASARSRAAAAWAAAWDAAWDAAWAAAWDAARDAGYKAARSALRPTEQFLTASAFDLLDRMIAVGKKEVATV